MEAQINYYVQGKHGGATIDLKTDVNGPADLKDLVQELIGPRRPIKSPVDIADEAPPPPAKPAYMLVGKATGRPGETVEISITGGSGGRRVDGFGLAVGLGHRFTDMTLELGDFFQQYLGETKTFVWHKFLDGNPEAFWNAYLGFFGMTPSAITGFKDPIIVPYETELLKARITIPSDHPPFTQTLFCKDNWYYKQGGIRVQCMFTTAEIPEGLDVEIDERAGQIEVTA